jgi:hypothetical protein
MNKLYINIDDYQGGTWALGETCTLKEWRELAMCWNDSDEDWGSYEALKRYEIKNSELCDYISSYWSLNIVPFDETNEEHLQLKLRRERY